MLRILGIRGFAPMRQRGVGLLGRGDWLVATTHMAQGLLRSVQVDVLSVVGVNALHVGVGFGEGDGFGEGVDVRVTRREEPAVDAELAGVVGGYCWENFGVASAWRRSLFLFAGMRARGM